MGAAAAGGASVAGRVVGAYLEGAGAFEGALYSEGEHAFGI